MAKNDDKNYCLNCGKKITADEVAITKKLVNRGTTKYYCIHCLAEFFDVTSQDVENKIIYFKEMGCTLFE